MKACGLQWWLVRYARLMIVSLACDDIHGILQGMMLAR